jgi:hypothetical protein
MGGRVVARERYNKNRDCRFDDWRRNSVEKSGKLINLPLYSTDLDGVEYIYTDESNIEPVALIEKKHSGSRWKTEWRGAMVACFELARRSGLPFYVAEHSTDCSVWSVYMIKSIEHAPENPILDNVSLFDYICFLCDLHNYELSEFYTNVLQSVVAISKNGESIP